MVGTALFGYINCTGSFVLFNRWVQRKGIGKGKTSKRKSYIENVTWLRGGGSVGWIFHPAVEYLIWELHYITLNCLCPYKRVEF